MSKEFMAEPKKRMTSTRSGNRQSHDHLKKINLSICSQCKEPKIPHRVCKFCGYYNNKEVIIKKSKNKK